MRRERVSKKESELEDLEDAQLVLTADEKAFLWRQHQGYGSRPVHQLAGRPAGPLLPRFQKVEQGAAADCSQALKSEQGFLCWALYLLGPVASLFLPFAPFWSENVSPLASHCILDADNLRREEFHLRMDHP